jgi:hypothetical protein
VYKECTSLMLLVPCSDDTAMTDYVRAYAAGFIVTRCLLQASQIAEATPLDLNPVASAIKNARRDS